MLSKFDQIYYTFGNIKINSFFKKPVVDGINL